MTREVKEPQGKDDKANKAAAREARTKKMLIFYLLVTSLSAIAIVWKLIDIQWVSGDMWRMKLAERSNKVVNIPAQRGNIYSSDCSILVSTVKECDLCFDFGEYKQRSSNGRDYQKDANGTYILKRNGPKDSLDKYIDYVRSLLQEARPSKTAAEYKAMIMKGWEKKNGCCRIAKIPYSTWTLIRNCGGWRRFVLLKDGSTDLIYERRVPTFGSLAGNVIGYANHDANDTYTSLEGAYDSILRGQDGTYLGRLLSKWVVLTNDIDDTVRIDSTLIQRPVINGKHIVATIDSRYQDVAENALCTMLRRYGGASGCVVLMEIETGYVLACANVVRDSTNPRGYAEHPYNNVAVSHLYEPGSTFKTVALTAMLNDHIVDTSYRVRTGFKTYGNAGYIEDSRGHAVADTHSVKRAFIHSSNVGMAELGYIFYRNQRKRLTDSIKAIFPYMADGMLHLDLREPEYAARITDPNKSMSDFLRICYGYANMVSPMQVLTFYNALGHPRRQMMKPLFCKAIISGRDTIVIRPRTLKNGRPICSAETQAIMTDLLTHVVEEGTATNLRNETYPIAGKTGTANTIYGQGGRQMNNGSFVGYFPANQPKYTCIVVGEGIGSNNGRQTAEVFKELADCVMAMDKSLGNISLEHKLKDLEMKQVSREPWVKKAQQADLMRAYGIINLPYLSSDSLAFWTIYQAGQDSLDTRHCYTPYQRPTDVVPDCTGMTAKDAVALLKSMGLNVKVKGCGRVQSQFPKARAACKRGNTVTLNLGN